jgi:tripartite-type tricarboxylate transporter receptor subunit TctC
MRLAAVLCAAIAGPASAQTSVETFYKDKSIDLYVPSTGGGTFDVYARLVGKHLGRYVPGNPSFVIRNMPGASGMQMTNFLQSGAPRDGTAIGLPPPQSALNQIFQMPGVRYDARQLTWLFRVAPVVEVTFTWHTSPTRKAADLFTRETLIGSVGPNSGGAIYMNQLNNLLGAKTRLVHGYPGMTETLLAIERGEVEGGTKPWAGLKSENGEWLRDNKLQLLLTYGRERFEEIPDVPTLLELAKTDLDQRVFRFLSSSPAVGRALATTPGVPADRVAALRAGFMAMAKDAEYLNEARRLSVDLGPLEGGALQALVEETFSHAPDAVARAKEASGL